MKVASAWMLLQEEMLKSKSNGSNATTAAAGGPLADFLFEWPLRTRVERGRHGAASRVGGAG